MTITAVNTKIIDMKFVAVFNGLLWLVTHYNENDSIVSRFIEVTEMPDVLRSQREDIVYALDKLVTELGTEET